MISAYTKIAWRHLLKNKTSSLINAGGLAIGMAVTILIGLWMTDELAFDKSFDNYENIAQVMQHQTFNGDVRTDKAIPIPLSAKLRQDYAGDFKYLVLSSWTNSHIFSYSDKNLSYTGNYMERDAPEILSLKMLSGQKNGIQDPSSILISNTVATSLFGNIDAFGKILKLDGTDLKVTGVYEDFPVTSSFNNVFFIAPWSLYAKDPEVSNATADWGANSFQLFAQLEKGRSAEQLSAKIKDVKRVSIGQDAVASKPVIFLHPMNKWHLYSEFKNGVNTGGKIDYIWMFGIIGLFVLLLACINFMNLSTARSEKRAKEVGIRKSIGSLRRQMIFQFYSESLLTVLISFAISLLVVQMILPFFNKIAGKELSLPWLNPLFWFSAIVIITVTALLAGSYPALYLSSFKPIKVLKGTFKVGKNASLPRKVLVVIQFSVSIILVVGTTTVFRQIQKGKDRSAGYDHNGLVIIRPYTDDFHKHIGAVRNDLIKTGLITDLAEGSFVSKGSRTSGGLQWKGKNPSLQDNIMTFAVSTEYGKTIGWKLAAGRDFSKELSTDSASIILNQAAVDYMGFTNPVGEIVNWGKQYTVIGVTQNIVMKSPFDPAVPTIYYMSDEPNYLNIKIKTGADEGKALAAIETIYKKYSPSSPFEYKLGDQEYERKFADEERVRGISVLFTIFAIFISCIGLFGLAQFISEQRTKEIGIRKVVGASSARIWSLLSKEFIKLILISLFVSIPVSWFLMDAWLQNYQYRTELSWWVFATVAISVLFLTMITVSFQSIKMALMNPVKAMRTE